MVTEKGIASYLFRRTKEPLDAIRISRAMRTPVVTVNGDASINKCTEMMIDNSISSLIDRDGNSLNILTKSDLVKLYSDHYRKIYWCSR
jgi:predicted transcriptional regulator